MGECEYTVDEQDEDEDTDSKPKKRKKKKKKDDSAPRTTRRHRVMTDVFIDQVILSSSAEEGQNCGRKFLERLVENQGIYELNTPGRFGARAEGPRQ